MVNKTPSETNKMILGILFDGIDINDLHGNFSKKEEWMNPKRIQGEIKNKFGTSVGRDVITGFLDGCYNHEEKYVDRKSKKDEKNPSKKNEFVEPKAQNEYKILENGKKLLEYLNDPRQDFVTKRY